ncbi:urease accessory protein UreF [Rhizobium deserti]|uniref:Urease accessory protein UreF n=1 Tax=Rhizobium deserti TaxID=2547961 RepID=A0A4R5UPN1_9HYPH|nr:urease accessory protein UreF [Rhizobium deserti]TDK39778.1 urease accessory protein UreF [Rhizobium deserti]
MPDTLDTKALLRLMAWLSPAFPIGGFAWSGGLERAVHDRLVKDAADVEAWLSALLQRGTLWNDAVLFAEVWRHYDDEAVLKELAELGLAMAGSAERFAETLSLGKAFVAAATAWPHPVLDRLPGEVPYPVAVGAVAAAHKVPLSDGLAAYLHAAISQSVSASIRLGACGQVEGVAILAGMEDLLAEIGRRVSTTTLEDLGGAAVQAEIASLRHETQYSRLFRS